MLRAETAQMGPAEAGGAQATYARIAGLGYLIIIVTGIYAEFFVRGGLIAPEDAMATAANIQASGGLYRSALAAEFAMLMADVVVAWAIYMIFRRVSEGLALLAAFLRLAHAAVLGMNLLTAYVPLVLLGTAAYLDPIGLEGRQSLALLLLDAHAYGYAIGLVFFAGHCAVLGYLVLRSALVPGVLGVLLLVAAAGYLIDSLGRTLLADYAAYEVVLGMIVLLPALVAELSFSLWLVVRGVRTDEPAREGRNTSA